MHLRFIILQVDNHNANNYRRIPLLSNFKSKWLVLMQSCKRHAIRARVKKASKQVKEGQCLPCEHLVQGKTHVEKKALLAEYFIPLL